MTTALTAERLTTDNPENEPTILLEIPVSQALGVFNALEALQDTEGLDECAAIVHSELGGWASDAGLNVWDEM